MTADEIIQALEGEIHQVEYVDGTYADGVDLELLKNALVLINRQKSEIERLKSADVSPVRHGRWVKEKTDVLIHWHCSACEECFFLDKPNSEYCPHCGAKMDEEENENDREGSFN